MKKIVIALLLFLLLFGCNQQKIVQENFEITGKLVFGQKIYGKPNCENPEQALGQRAIINAEDKIYELMIPELLCEKIAGLENKTVKAKGILLLETIGKQQPESQLREGTENYVINPKSIEEIE